ncbi:MULTISPECIES: hypothetical protein [Protofrankia]|uniref:Uncharacterized protein n=1 Tax=Protofrankia coriariae TaxID=1562887 RepID=A0ABR5F6R1_9ACTN|nr:MULTISPECIES: hypothetical protein [Protofrankia]KLL12358.1 hypothetical protein FrCorBMG51_04870 [Protofrankia coriariae]ONH37332.1 hypothetical protein BL254_04630 [Protofrankia sp. BMG5.30]
MAPAGLSWQTLHDVGALALVDTDSQRAAAVVRPCTPELDITDIVEAERLVQAWVNATTRQEAEAALATCLRVDAVRLLQSLGWLLAMWAVTLHLRTGEQPHMVIRSLTYRGVWRGAQAPLSEQVWESLSERIRVGALAALTGDAEIANAFRQAVQRPVGIAEVLLHHALVVMDDLARSMHAIGVDPTNLAQTLAVYTAQPSALQPPSFRPLK